MIKLNIDKKCFASKFYPELFDYTHRWEVYRGSAGSGKSYFITQKLIIRALREPIRILVCRRYGTTIRQTCFNLFKDVLTKWKLTQYVKINESDYRIRFPNGSEIIFQGLDEESKLLSLSNIGTVFIEEAFEVPYKIVEQLNLRMRGNTVGQQIIMAFNPINKRHWLYDFCEVNPPKSFKYSISTYKDNPFLSNEYINALEELYTRNPQRAKVFCDGDWGVDSEGLVLQNWKVGEFKHEDIIGDLCIGMDFGYVNDPSTLVASLIDNVNKKMYVFKEWGSTNKTNNQLADIIKSLGFSKSTIIADCAEPKSIEELKQHGILRIKPSVKGSDSIMHGIQRLQQYEIIVHPSCKELLTELENYTWDKDRKTDEWKDKPIDQFNHYIDAMRYSLQCLDVVKLKTMSKADLGL